MRTHHSWWLACLGLLPLLVIQLIDNWRIGQVSLGLLTIYVQIIDDIKNVTSSVLVVLLLLNWLLPILHWILSYELWPNIELMTTNLNLFLVSSNILLVL